MEKGKEQKERLLMTMLSPKNVRISHSLRMNWLRACASTSDQTMQKCVQISSLSLSFFLSSPSTNSKNYTVYTACIGLTSEPFICGKTKNIHV